MKARWLIGCTLAIVVTTVGLIVALSGSDDDPTTGTPPPVLPTATAEAIQGIERVPVRWLPADVVDATSAVEMTVPFAEQQRQMVEVAIGNGRDASSVGPARWALYVAGATGPPRLLYEGGRWIDSLEWEGGSIVASFRTRRQVKSAALVGEATLPWRGSVTIDPGGRVVEKLDPAPLDCVPCTADSQVGALSAGSGLGLQRDDAGKQFLASVSVATGPPTPPAPLFRIAAVYVADLQGKGHRLEGITGLWNVGWFANGKAILGFGGQAFQGSQDIYLIPTLDGDAILIAKPLGFAPEGHFGKRANRAAFVLPGADDQTIRVGIYNADTGQMRIVAERPTANFHFQPTPLGRTLTVTWPEGSELIQVGTTVIRPQGSPSELIDVNTGAARQGTLYELQAQFQPQPPPACPPDVPSLSPSGRYFVSADRRERANLAPCGAAFRLQVQDSQTGVTRTLVEVPEEACIEWEWWSETKLRVTVTSFCNAFHGPLPIQILVFDAQTGGSESLTDGFEESAYIEAAPGGGHLLTTATRLRLYSSDGVLLRDYGPPPPGYAFYQRVWSPDGTTLAFLLGPANWLFGP